MYATQSFLASCFDCLRRELPTFRVLSFLSDDPPRVDRLAMLRPIIRLRKNGVVFFLILTTPRDTLSLTLSSPVTWDDDDVPLWH